MSSREGPRGLWGGEKDTVGVGGFMPARCWTGGAGDPLFLSSWGAKLSGALQNGVTEDPPSSPVPDAPGSLGGVSAWAACLTPFLPCHSCPCVALQDRWGTPAAQDPWSVCVCGELDMGRGPLWCFSLCWAPGWGRKAAGCVWPFLTQRPGCHVPLLFPLS